MLDDCAIYTDYTIRYKQSDMVLCVHSDGLYLSEYHARSQDGGGVGVEVFNQSDHNGAILAISQII